MVTLRLLQATCTIALLAAAPAFAQETNNPSADTTMHNHVNVEPNSSSTMSPGSHMGMNETHHMKRHARASMHNKSDMAQDNSADQLNEKSLEAARGGQAFNGAGSGDMSSHGGSGMNEMSNHPGSGMNEMSNPPGSGSMNDMSGGSMGGSGAPGQQPAK